MFKNILLYSIFCLSLSANGAMVIKVSESEVDAFGNIDDAWSYVRANNDKNEAVEIVIDNSDGAKSFRNFEIDGQLEGDEKVSFPVTVRLASTKYPVLFYGTLLVQNLNFFEIKGYSKLRFLAGLELTQSGGVIAYKAFAIKNVKQAYVSAVLFTNNNLGRTSDRGEDRAGLYIEESNVSLDQVNLKGTVAPGRSGAGLYAKKSTLTLLNSNALGGDGATGENNKGGDATTLINVSAKIFSGVFIAGKGGDAVLLTTQADSVGLGSAQAPSSGQNGGQSSSQCTMPGESGAVVGGDNSVVSISRLTQKIMASAGLPHPACDHLSARGQIGVEGEGIHVLSN